MEVHSWFLFVFTAVDSSAISAPIHRVSGFMAAGSRHCVTVTAAASVPLLMGNSRAVGSLIAAEVPGHAEGDMSRMEQTASFKYSYTVAFRQGKTIRHAALAYAELLLYVLLRR